MWWGSTVGGNRIEYLKRAWFVTSVPTIFVQDCSLTFSNFKLAWYKCSLLEKHQIITPPKQSVGLSILSMAFCARPGQVLSFHGLLQNTGQVLYFERSDFHIFCDPHILMSIHKSNSHTILHSELNQTEHFTLIK